MDQTKRIELLRNYPFLKPYKYNPECLDTETSLMTDALPRGWQGFVPALCEEIKQCVVENGMWEEYQVLQVKEKYGGLRWYDNCSCTRGVIEKYEKVSRSTCAICGEPSTHLTKGYILPLCDD